ncbi:MAG: hypothetical protein AAF602_03775, partial [Myxococcota bacterium]
VAAMALAPEASPPDARQGEAPHVAPRPPRPLVCAPVGEAGSARDVKLDYCMSQLEALRAEQRLVRNPWPTDDPVWDGQRPDEWNETMEEVFEACDLPADVVVTDCSEPPCVAALRVDDPDALGEAILACEPFLDAFPQPEAGLTPLAVPCGDGRFDRMMLLTTFDEEQRRAYFSDLGLQDAMDDDDLSAFVEGYRILARRADWLVGMWDCPEP